MTRIGNGPRLTLAALIIGLAPPVATAQQTPQPLTAEAESGAPFQCQDGSKMILSFATTDAGLAAMVRVHGASYQLLNVPPEPGPVRVVWSDGDHSLTWSPGVQLMWMSEDTHLMCGRGGGHKH